MKKIDDIDLYKAKLFYDIQSVFLGLENDNANEIGDILKDAIAFKVIRLDKGMIENVKRFNLLSSLKTKESKNYKNAIELFNNFVAGMNQVEIAQFAEMPLISFIFELNLDDIQISQIVESYLKGQKHSNYKKIDFLRNFDAYQEYMKMLVNKYLANYDSFKYSDDMDEKKCMYFFSVIHKSLLKGIYKPEIDEVYKIVYVYTLNYWKEPLKELINKNCLNINNDNYIDIEEKIIRGLEARRDNLNPSANEYVLLHNEIVTILTLLSAVASKNLILSRKED